ncbi:hypothetical protein niasHS_010642 [Heterodera schachtii]|uniref:RING-type domain-containing protein n=1 Tax=Heterodera schachtii TaxID=97005 RepID=A0ABD2IYW7_HETSC
MLLSDPLSSSSLFLQPLSPLPDFQFSPANLQKPSTIATPMAAASVAVSRREIMESLSAVPIAEKSSLIETEKDGRRRLGKTEKGRRHAGEAVLRRKLANHAFLVRVEGVGKESGEGRPAGGRGRRRALSERVAAEFAPSVPYSLNRRSRWAKLSGGEWLAELANLGGAVRGDRLRLLLAEADYSLDGSESIRALHSLDAEKGLLHSRWGKSGRGAASIGHLSSTDSQTQQQENSDPSWDDAVEDVLFHLQRPHPVAKVFAAKFFKRTKAFRSAKRCAVQSAFGAKTSNGQPPQQQTEGPRRKAVAVPESEAEEENEFVAQYRPRQETYSLADFVRETCSPPVMVRRQQKGTEAHLSEEFAIVPMPECVPLSSRCSSADSPAVSSPAFAPCDSFPNRLSSANPGTFLRFPFAADLSLFNDLKVSKSEWHPTWLCEGTLMFDLSRQLSPKMETPVAVMILDGAELIINTVFPLSADSEKLIELVNASAELGTDRKLDELLKVIGPDFAEWSAKTEPSRALLNSSALDAHRSVFHATRLAVSSLPTTVYDILAAQRAEWASEEGQFVKAEEMMKVNSEQQNGEGAEGDDEFELIEMAELGADDEQKGTGGANPGELVSQCADCERCPVPRLAMLRSCGHRICRECISKSAEEQTKADQAAELRCPVCSVPVPLDLLPLFLPLPLANSFALLHFVRNSPRPLAQCPGCSGLLLFSDQSSIQSIKIYRHFLCARCSLLWCSDCNSLPHWPLNCAQNIQWLRRFAQHERCQQELPEAKGGAIAAQFAQICSEAHTRRMDLKLGSQLGKQIRRLLGDAKAERRFMEARKTALHLLEFGTAWLYLFRQSPRPPAWSQLRSLLWALRDLTESLDNELLFSASLSDVRGLKERIEKLEGIVEKTQQKFADEAK